MAHTTRAERNCGSSCTLYELRFSCQGACGETKPAGLAGGNTCSRLRVRLRDACSFRSRMAQWRPRIGPVLSPLSIRELCFPVKAGILIQTDQAAVSSRPAFGRRGVMLRTHLTAVKGNFRRSRRRPRLRPISPPVLSAARTGRMVHFGHQGSSDRAGRDAIRCDSSAG
jgi:hypothetical protein